MIFWTVDTLFHFRLGLFFNFFWSSNNFFLRDEQGRKVVLSCAGKFDPYKYTAADMAKTHSLVVEYLMDDEENQIRGYSYVNDESGLLMGHISLWSLTDIRSMLKCIQNSTPMRHKATHFINVPSYANKVFEFFIGLLNDKLKSRIMVMIVF